MRDSQTADVFSGAITDVCNATYDLGEAFLDLFYDSQRSPIVLTALGRTYRFSRNPTTKKIEAEELWARHSSRPGEDDPWQHLSFFA